MCYTTSQNSSVWSLFNTIPTYCNGQTCPLRAPYVWCMRARHTFWLEGERAGRGATKQQMDENEFQADHGKVKPSVTVACTELHKEIPTQLSLKLCLVSNFPFKENRVAKRTRTSICSVLFEPPTFSLRPRGLTHYLARVGHRLLFDTFLFLHRK